MRTPKEWYNIIVAEKESLQSLDDLGYQGDDAETLLADLNSNSKVSIWRLWAWVMAYCSWLIEACHEAFKKEVDTKLIAKPGTGVWLAGEVLKFQFGDQLEFNTDGSYGYAIHDESKQIIKYVAVSRGVGQTVVKVAKESGGVPVALTNEELSSFQGFLHKIQYSGTSVIGVSESSDKLKLNLTVFYDGIVPVDIIRANVEAAIQSYLVNLEFDGTFRVSSLIDDIQEVEGVVDYQIGSIEVKPDAGVYVSVDRKVNPSSGYLEIDPAFPLSANITYSAE